MTYCKVTFENGLNYITSINGTEKEIKDYYLGNVFNVGSGEYDDMQKCVSCEVAKTYKASFTGRTVNAIGIFYPITDTVQGLNKEDAEINLYEKYDHITGLTLEEVSQ